MTNICEVGAVIFPSPTGIEVNMMPFVVGDNSTLPIEVRGYIPLICACRLESSQLGKISYLSIQESNIVAGLSQRRPGLHTEGHLNVGWGEGWGSGRFDGTCRDGLYMASTVMGSCRAYDYGVKVTGDMGDCEYLREDIERDALPVTMQANRLYWLTDRCPHESLPLNQATHRQWFRLVTHKVDLWYADHSTHNSLVQPDCRIVTGDKFLKGVVAI